MARFADINTIEEAMAFAGNAKGIGMAGKVTVTPYGKDEATIVLTGTTKEVKALTHFWKLWIGEKW